MPYEARRSRKKATSQRWAIVNKQTGRVVGYSSTKRKAQISASYRNRAHR